MVAGERCGVPVDRVADLALAVHELAANSVLHGGGHGVLRIWCESRALLCEVTDQGQVLDPLTGRHHVEPEGSSGRGLWMVNHLCDLVQLRSSDAGTVVRVHTDLSRHPRAVGKPREVGALAGPGTFQYLQA